MPLIPPAPRAPIHHRQIDCRGYRREDGLWDLEARLIDTKAYPFANAWRGEIQPGEPIHDMWLRLTLDDELTVIRAEAATVAARFPSARRSPLPSRGSRGSASGRAGGARCTRGWAACTAAPIL